ncbi:MAG: CinA family protein [Reinekea forsetii]|nr:CinA family protein [Reinekea forsetii]
MLAQLAQTLLARKLTLSSVESCTGGGLAAQCTDLPGSSAWFLGSVVTYANSMKLQLGLDPHVLTEQGAVSAAVVSAMAQKGLEYCASDWCVAISGVAGPDGGSAEKPVGTVWLAWAQGDQVWSEHQLFSGSRQQIRQQAIDRALGKLLILLN